MFDRKALTLSLHALHNSEIKAGKDDEILKDAIGKIIGAIEVSRAGLGEDDSRHLSEAIDALADGHHFLARSSILLILEGAQSPDNLRHKPLLTLPQLRERLTGVTV